MRKIIHLALSRPGAGKTFTACKVVMRWLQQGKKVLFVVPTKLLAAEVCSELASHNPVRIESSPGSPAIAELNKNLHAAQLTYLIVCQHAAYHQCKEELLRDWIVVVDELPHPISFSSTPISNNQLDVLRYFDVGAEGKLLVKPGCTRKVKLDVKNFECAGIVHAPASLLSDHAYQICKAVLEGVDVYVSAYGMGQTLVYYSVEAGFLERFDKCKELHLLSATWDGSLFEWFATAKGYETTTSVLTPVEPPPHKFVVSIYPLLSLKKCSKSVLDSVLGLDGSGKEIKVYQSIANMVSKLSVDGCLVFAHEWARFDIDPNLTVCPLDSRGVNHLAQISNVLCLFHGNHLPICSKAFEAVATKYGRPVKTLYDAWTRTNLYERTLQCVYRCSLRDRHSFDNVNLYVQDESVAVYLKEMYIHDAIIDCSYIREYRSAVKPGPKSEFADKELAVFEQLVAGIKPKKVAQDNNVRIEFVYEVNRKRKAHR